MTVKETSKKLRDIYWKSGMPRKLSLIIAGIYAAYYFLIPVFHTSSHFQSEWIHNIESNSLLGYIILSVFLFFTIYPDIRKVARLMDKAIRESSFSVIRLPARNVLKEMTALLADNNPINRWRAEIYIRRQLCPRRILLKSGRINTEEHFPLFVYRNIEEVIPIGKERDADHFEDVQIQDYKALFEMVQNCYYVATYKDHDIWRIEKPSDLDYYEYNYVRNKKLTAKDQVLLTFQGRMGEVSLTPGIHRLFIFPTFLRMNDGSIRIEINETSCHENNHGVRCDEPLCFVITPQIITEFIFSVSQMIKKERTTIQYGPLLTAAISAGGNIERHVLDFLSAALGAKIHEQLKIDYRIVMENVVKKDGRIKSGIVSAPRCQNSVEWECLGSAVFDTFMHCYSVRDRHNSIYYIKFDKFEPAFATDITEHFDVPNNSDLDFPEFDTIAKEAASIVMARPLTSYI